MLLRLFAFLAMSSIACTSLGQRNIQLDTLKSDSIRLNPAGIKKPVEEVGTYVLIINDTIAFQAYAGLNVINTLRGHTANLQLGENAFTARGGIRSSDAALIIDGIPYDQKFRRFYNTNAFEFQKIYAVPSANGISAFGRFATEGAVILESKSGKGISSPTIDFSSFTSFLSTSPNGNSFTPDGRRVTSSEQWIFNNAVAFAQDFGAVDTRISINSSYHPTPIGQTKNREGIQFIKVNTGFEITKKLNARIILDGLYNKAAAKTFITFLNPSDTTPFGNVDKLAKSIQGNLMLSYQINHILSITSQTLIARRSLITQSLWHSLDSSDKHSRELSREYSRDLSTLFFNGTKQISNGVHLSAFTGFQLENVNSEMVGKAVSGNQTIIFPPRSKQGYLNNAMASGLNASFKDCFFLNFRHRYDWINSFEKGKPHTFSVNSAFLFSNLLNLKSDWFDFGRIRASYGRSLYLQNENDFRFFDAAMLPSNDISPRRVVEAGLDLSLKKHQMKFCITYFYNYEKARPTGDFYRNVNEFHHRGWEFTLSANPVRTTMISLHSSLSLATSISFDGENAPERKYLRSRTYVADPIASLLNQLIIKNVFLNILIDAQSGGRYFSYADSRTIDNSHMMLRDFSIGFINNAGNKNSLVKRTAVSLSTRNLWVIAKNRNYGGTPFSSTEKISSLSINLTF